MPFVNPPRPLTGRDLVIFDGACGFCTWSVMQLPRLGVRVTAVPFQWLADAELTSLGVTRAACVARVHFIDAAGTVRTGADAINALVRGTQVLGAATRLIARSPGLMEVERRCYDWVAAHRVAISRLLGTRRYALIIEDDDAERGSAG